MGGPRAHQSNQVTKSFLKLRVSFISKAQETTDDFPMTFSGLEQPHSAARDTVISKMGLPRQDASGTVSASRAISGDHCRWTKLCRSGYAGLVKDL